MTPSSRAGYINQEWSASGTYESANFKIIELKVFQIKEIYAPAKLFRIGGVQRPSDRTGASLIVSSCIECIGSAKKRSHSLCKNLNPVRSLLRIASRGSGIHLSLLEVGE